MSAYIHLLERPQERVSVRASARDHASVIADERSVCEMLQGERFAYPAAVQLQTEIAAAGVRFAYLHRVCTVCAPCADRILPTAYNVGARCVHRNLRFLHRVRTVRHRSHTVQLLKCDSGLAKAVSPLQVNDSGKVIPRRPSFVTRLRGDLIPEMGVTGGRQFFSRCCYKTFRHTR
jgi:hypothetical protein